MSDEKDEKTVPDEDLENVSGGVREEFRGAPGGGRTPEPDLRIGTGAGTHNEPPG